MKKTPDLKKESQQWNDRFLNTMKVFNNMGLTETPKTTTKSQHFKDSLVMDANGKSVPASQVANDNSYAAQSPNVSAGFFNQMNNLLVTNFFMGWAELAILQQNPLLYQICKIRADECTSKWIEIISTGEDKEDRIKELELEFERLDVKKVFHRAKFMNMANGGCLVYPKLKGDEHDNERAKPLIIDSVKINKGDLEYLQIIEPMWYVPIKYNTIDPFSKWFYKPEMYVVLGMMIHESRICKFIMNEAPNILKPTYLFNGISVIQQCANFVMQFQTAKNAITQIIPRFNLAILKTNLEAISGNAGETAEVNTSALKNRIAALNYYRDNLGTFAIDMELEDFEQITMSLQNLAELLAQSGEYVCAVANTPATKLFGTAPQGFNATGEHEMNNWYDVVRGDQENELSPHLRKIMDLAMLNIWGEIDPEITFRWNTLEAANELEESTIRGNDATRDVAYVGAGVLTPQQVAERLANDPESKYDGIEILEENFENMLEGIPDEPSEENN